MQTPTFHPVEQNSEEWLQLRTGRIGGSSIGKIMANYGKVFGQPAKDLAVKIALEQITGNRTENGYSNAHMERGHEQEPVARMLYEETYFCDVFPGGYFSSGDMVGVSPDGLVYDDGLIEIKSVIDTVHFSTIKRGRFDPSYQWQLYFNLMVTGREWIDFVSFCSDFPEGKKLFVDRVTKNESEEQFDMIRKRVEEFMVMVSEAREVITA
jgi:hypothetical protein